MDCSYRDNPTWLVPLQSLDGGAVLFRGESSYDVV